MSDQNSATFDLGKEGFVGKVTTLRHTIDVDEPVEAGGTDLYPGPRNLLLGSLTSCTAITMRMYAQRKDWDTGRIHIAATLEEIPGVDGKTYKIRKEVTFENKALTEEQIERLLKIGTRCPMNRIIEGTVEMELVAVP